MVLLCRCQQPCQLLRPEHLEFCMFFLKKRKQFIFQTTFMRRNPMPSCGRISKVISPPLVGGWPPELGSGRKPLTFFATYFFAKINVSPSAFLKTLSPLLSANLSFPKNIFLKKFKVCTYRFTFKQHLFLRPSFPPVWGRLFFVN